MALIKYGGGVSVIAGKQGGAVHARNRAGAYIRNWAKPSGGPTASQTVRRAQFAAQSNAWRDLTDAQREDWNTFAAGMTAFNRLADAYTPTGRQVFISCNQNLSLVGEAAILDAPFGAVPPSIAHGWTTNFIVAGGIVTNIFAVPLSATFTGPYLVFAAPPQLGQKVNQILQYRVITAVDLTSGPDMAAAYIAIFGATAALDYTFRMKFRAVDPLSGLSSATVISECVTTT